MKPLLLALTLGLLTGCAGMDQWVYATNASSRMATAFSVRASSGFGFTYGNLSPGGPAGCSGMVRIKSNDSCEVSWVDANGKSHSVKLLLQNELPRGYYGDITFILHENQTVTARPGRRGVEAAAP